MKHAIQLPSDDGTTGNKEPLYDAVSRRRNSRRSHLDRGCGDQAFQAWCGSRLALPMRLRAGGRARPTNADSLQTPKLRGMSNDWHRPARQVAPSPIQKLAAHDRPLHRTEKQVLSRLRRARHLGLFALDRRRGWADWLGVFRAGYGRAAYGANFRAAGCELRLRAKQLRLGLSHSPRAEQAQRAVDRVPRRKSAHNGLGRADWHPLFHVVCSPQKVAGRASFDGTCRQIADRQAYLNKINGWLR